MTFGADDCSADRRPGLVCSGCRERRCGGGNPGVRWPPASCRKTPMGAVA